MTEARGQENAVRRLLDLEEIRTLRMTYSTALDTRRMELLHDVFTDSAVVSVTVGDFVGIEAIKRGLNDAFDAYNWKGAATFPFMHALTNHVVSLSGPDTAEGSCYLLDFITGRNLDQHPLLVLGVYVDSYVRLEGRWRICRSRLDVPWHSHDA